MMILHHNFLYLDHDRFSTGSSVGLASDFLFVVGRLSC
jgi:hypothetical protein